VPLAPTLCRCCAMCRRYRVAQVAVRADELRLWESAMERRLLRNVMCVWGGGGWGGISRGSAVL
jgi:hypothetical protein